MKARVPVDFDDYARAFSPKVVALLRTMRRAIRAAAPEATEAISYGIPAFVLSGKKLAWFAAFKSHIGFYPGAAAMVVFKKELAGYKTAKGSVQFPFAQTLPTDLIRSIVAFNARRLSR